MTNKQLWDDFFNKHIGDLTAMSKAIYCEDGVSEIYIKFIEKDIDYNKFVNDGQRFAYIKACVYNLFNTDYKNNKRHEYIDHDTANEQLELYSQHNKTDFDSKIDLDKVNTIMSCLSNEIQNIFDIKINGLNHDLTKRQYKWGLQHGRIVLNECLNPKIIKKFKAMNNKMDERTSRRIHKKTNKPINKTSYSERMYKTNYNETDYCHRLNISKYTVKYLKKVYS